MHSLALPDLEADVRNPIVLSGARRTPRPTRTSMPRARPSSRRRRQKERQLVPPQLLRAEKLLANMMEVVAVDVTEDAAEPRLRDSCLPVAGGRL